VLLIWDSFFIHGWKVLFKVALAMLHSAQDILVGLPFEESLKFLKTLHNDSRVSCSDILQKAEKFKVTNRMLVHLERAEKAIGPSSVLITYTDKATKNLRWKIYRREANDVNDQKFVAPLSHSTSSSYDKATAPQTRQRSWLLLSRIFPTALEMPQKRDNNMAQRRVVDNKASSRIRSSPAESRKKGVNLDKKSLSSNGPRKQPLIQASSFQCRVQESSNWTTSVQTTSFPGPETFLSGKLFANAKNSYDTSAHLRVIGDTSRASSISSND